MSGIKVTVTFKREEAEDSDSAADLENTAGNYEGLPAEEIAKCVAQDLARLAAYRRGEWHYIGIRAVATIWIQRDNYRTNYEITSPGVWGIESDSEPSYLESVFKDECSVLQADIIAMGAAEFKL